MASNNLLSTYNISDFKRGKKLGEGAYGIVYDAEDRDNNKFALKRNRIDSTVSFNASIREMDILNKLYDHHNICKLVDIAKGVDGVYSPRKDDRKYRDDKISFVFERATSDLHHFIHDVKYRYRYDILKYFMCQILVGTECLHHRGIVHRDLKLANILVFENYQVQLADFGLSTHYTDQQPGTPDLYSLPYRPPEVCKNYKNVDCGSSTFKGDVWSIGCMFFEMISHNLFVKFTKGEQELTSNELLANILYAVEDELPIEKVKSLIGSKSRFYNSNRNKFFVPYSNKLNLSSDKKTKFEAEAGKFDEFCDLLKNMLKFDHETRYSISDCINHPFFNDYREFFDQYKKLYIKENPEPVLNLVSNKERQWMKQEARNVYNNASGALDWYSHRILFQSISLFDRYLYHLKVNVKVASNAIESDMKGLYHSQEEVRTIFWTCIYICVKYFSVNREIPPLKEIVPKNISISNMEYYENMLLFEVFNKNIYQHTLFEAGGFVSKQEGRITGNKRIVEDENFDLHKYLITFYLIKQEINGMTITEAYKFFVKLMNSVDIQDENSIFTVFY